MSALKLAALAALLLLQPASAVEVEVNSGNGAVSFQEVGAKTITAEAAEADSLLCYQFEERLADGTVVKISRSKTYGQIFKGFAKVLVVGALLAAIVALGMYTSGLFEAFLAANEGQAIYNIKSAGGYIISKTYMGMYYNKVAIATLVSTTAMMAGTTGAGAGTMAALAANRIGMEWQQFSDNQKVGDEIKWLSSLKDTCNYVHFDVLKDGKAKDWKESQVEGPWTKYSYGTDGIFELEKDTDAKAEEALTKWCSFHAKHNLFGEARPDACKHVFERKPELKTCDGTVDESVKPKKGALTCANLLSLSSDEVQLKVLKSQMSVLKALGDHGEEEEDVGIQCGKGDACASVSTEDPDDAAYCALEKDENPTLCAGEVKADVLKEMEDLDGLKATGIFNCLALSSCQLLRKDYDKVKGRVRTIGSLGFKTQKHIDMRTTIIKKCLSHTSLVGPVAASEGCIPGKDCPEDLKEAKDDDSWAAKTGNDAEEFRDEEEDFEE